MAKHTLGRVQITRECNQECVFCAAPPAQVARSFEETKKEIIDLKKKGTTELMLTGGEPLKSKHIIDAIEFAKSLHFEEITIQTNASLLDRKFLQKVKDIYPNIKITVSVHASNKETYGKISGKPENFEKVMTGLKIIGELDISCYPAIVICSLNYKELRSHVMNLTKKFNYIKHISFNYIDPIFRAKENPWTVPKYCDTERYIHEMVGYMASNGISFRLERVPLCYMAGFEEFSSDIRRDVFNEKRMISFFRTKDDPDQQVFFEERETVFQYAPQCKTCSLKDLCPGINPNYVAIHGQDEVFPVFIDPKIIVARAQKSRSE